MHGTCIPTLTKVEIYFISIFKITYNKLTFSGMYVANQGYVNHQSNPTAWKWTALEVIEKFYWAKRAEIVVQGIRDEVWTSSSDVWSFGVSMFNVVC